MGPADDKYNHKFKNKSPQLVTNLINKFRGLIRVSSWLCANSNQFNRFGCGM